MKPKLPPLQLSQNPAGKPPPPEEKEAFQPDAAPAAEQSAAKNRKILVVDDNPVVLMAFELKLRASGFKVITVSEGSTVVNVASRENPDLIILDVNFPPGGGAGDLQWSGLTIMQWLDRFLGGSGIPIIIMTGDDPAKHKEKYLAAGAAAFFQKPVSYPELLSAIVKALQKPPG